MAVHFVITRKHYRSEEFRITREGNMNEFKRADVQDMFEIITSHLTWDQCGADSYYELEFLKNKMASGSGITKEELQKLYNVIQSARYYFNAHVDDPRFTNSFKMDATRFEIYYNLFLVSYPVKGLKNPQNKHGACYIATAVYGSYFDPKVLTLRYFRDEYLNKSKFGKIFIDIYYRVSPRLADRLEESKHFNKIIKGILNIFVFLIERSKK